MSAIFRFKEFSVAQDKAAMKIGTDAVLLGAWTEINADFDSILDIGSGTGILALMMAQRSSTMTIDAVEVNENAYLQSVTNFENSPWADRLYCYHASFEDFVEELTEENETYDLIITNPPFYADAFDTGDVARNKARFENALPFDALLEGVSRLLHSTGTFSTIIPYSSEVNFIKLAKNYGLHAQRIYRVQGNKESKIKRSLLSFSFEEKEQKISHLIIETARHQYTEEYIDLTKAFYLNM